MEWENCYEKEKVSRTSPRHCKCNKKITLKKYFLLF